MPRRLCLLAAAILGLAAGLPSEYARAQLSGGLGVGYLDYSDIGRWGVAGGVYIPVAGHAFDIVPNGTYYYSKWSVGSDEPQRDVFAASVDVHANLPSVATRLRPYVGAGITYAGAGGDTAFGLNLATGLYLRATSWRAFPFAQVTYRVIRDFETQPPLDTYALRGGLRVQL